MSMPVVHESDIEELDLPGQRLRWMVTQDNVDAQHTSTCVIRVALGQKVRSAHSHANSEEIIYIIRGTGRALVDGEMDEVRECSAVLFPQGNVHMLQNTGDVEMKVARFFSTPTELDNYKFFEDVDCPE